MNLVLIYQAQTLGKFTKHKHVLTYQVQTLSWVTMHKPCVNLTNANPLLTYQVQSLCFEYQEQTMC